MRESIDKTPPAEAGLAADPVGAAWAALRRHLESRSKDLNEEIRSYPTPIARCDEQLTKLIDQRAAALGQLKRMNDASANDPAHAACPSHAVVRRYLNSYPRSDDEIEMQIVARLKAALIRLPGSSH